MELFDLIGPHRLTGVDFDSIGYANVCRFELDGIVYSAIEDPEDGYRSCLRELKVETGVKLSNTFPPVPVVGRYCGRDCEIIEFYDTATEKLVLEVGTDYTDDYYPAFVCSFAPENLTHGER